MSTATNPPQPFPKPVTAGEVDAAEFTQVVNRFTGRHGYDENEVDDFLDRCAFTIAAQQREIQALGARLAESARAPGQSSQLTRTEQPIDKGRHGFWSYQECPRGVTGIAAHQRLGLVHRLRATDQRHACEDVIHPAISTSHRRTVALEDTTADLAPADPSDVSA